MKCAACPDKQCTTGKDCTGSRDDFKEKYTPDDLRMMKLSDILVEKYYMKKTRIEEIQFFAKKMRYQRLGLAFCSGLREEADILNRILSKDFKVFSAICKICGIDKTEFDPKPAPAKKKSISCNPLAQAEIMNQKKTDLNIVLGLCLGHDMLFAKYSKAPVTTLAVKDRVLANNPLGAIYSGYYRKKRFGLKN